jgi:hypothetical protein
VHVIRPPRELPCTTATHFALQLASPSQAPFIGPRTASGMKRAAEAVELTDDRRAEARRRTGGATPLAPAPRRSRDQVGLRVSIGAAMRPRRSPMGPRRSPMGRAVEPLVILARLMSYRRVRAASPIPPSPAAESADQQNPASPSGVFLTPTPSPAFPDLCRRYRRCRRGIGTTSPRLLPTPGPIAGRDCPA